MEAPMRIGCWARLGDTAPMTKTLSTVRAKACRIWKRIAERRSVDVIRRCIGATIMAWTIARHADALQVRAPFKTVAKNGRLAMFWSELRDQRIVPGASVSNDGGARWSRTVVFEAGGDGD